MDNPTQTETSTEAALSLSVSAIIDAMGGSAAVARICRVKLPAVSQWRINGIPGYRKQYLATLRPDLFPEESPAAAAQGQACT